MARRGEVSTREVSKKMEVHMETVRRWAKECIAGGDRSRFNRFSQVRVDRVGRYWFNEDELDSAVSFAPEDYI